MAKIRWIDAQGAGVKLGIVAAEDGDWVVAAAESRQTPAMMALQNRLGFRPWNVNLAAIRRPLKGLTVAQVIAALPGSREVVVERDSVFAGAAAAPPRPPQPAPARPPVRLGHNAQGEEVFTEEDGRRFVMAADGRRVDMPPEGGSRFLRVTNPADLPALIECARVLVGDMQAGTPVDAHRLRRFASVVFGYGRPEKFSSEMPLDDLRLRRFQEVFEAALVGALAEAAQRMGGRELFDLALRLYESQPVFGARTSTSVERQQYSTPLPMAVIASLLAAGENGDGLVVYEPAIGNGALVAALTRAQVIGADLDADRLAAVRVLPQVRAVAQGDTVADPPAEPWNRPEYAAGADVVIANPPFGGMPAQRYQNQLMVRRQDFMMALKALERRKPGGRAVFILGADSTVDSRAGKVTGGSRYFFNWLADHYHVEGVCEIDGSLYERQGAEFPVRLVVVGERGPGGEQVPDELPVIRDWDALWNWAQRTLGLREGPGAGAAEEPERRLINDYQTPYSPASRLGEASLMIPRNLAAATRECLAEIEQRRGQIDEYVAASLQWSREELAERLSPEQVDAVAMALDRAEEGKGFVLADQTGVGKGRVIACLVRYALLGGQRPVFLTEKANLFSDIYRDLADIGMADQVRPFILNADAVVLDAAERQVFRSVPADVTAALKAGDVPAQYNCVFATYSQFNRDFNKSAKAQWLARVAEGQPLILDESHNAAGESHTGENVAKAIAAASHAMFSSATFMKRAENLAIYWKLFPESVGGMDHLRATLKVGGEPLLEALSGMMARSGAMIRREHDLREVTFLAEIETAPERLQRNIRAADLLAEALDGMMRFSGDVEDLVEARNQEIKNSMRDLPEDVRKGSRMGASTLSFGSRLFQISKQFYSALKAEATSERAIRVLRGGGKPVIFTEGTGESLLDEIIGQGGSAYDVLPRDDSQAEAPLRVPTFKDLLHIVLDRLRTITERDRYGVPSKRDAAELCKSKEQVEAVEGAVKRLHDLIEMFPEMPVAPLDVIAKKIADAGYSCEELSGRDAKLAIAANGDAFLKPVPKRDRWAIISAFQRGDADAMVMTAAGSAGISLHAAATAADQRPRCMIMMDPPGDINKMVQAMGRVNRYGQVAPPTICMLGTGVVGETRLQMMTNRKLRQLSANVTSNQESASLNREIPDILNRVGNEVCYRWLVSSPDVAARLNIDLPDGAETLDEQDDLHFVNKLTSRILLLPNSMQEEVYDQLRGEYETRIAELESEGRNPLKSERLEWTDPRVEKETVYQAGDENDPFGAPVILQELSHEVETHPLRRAQVMEMAAAERDRLVRDPRFCAQGGNSVEALLPLMRRLKEQLEKRIEQAGKTVYEVMRSDENNTFKESLTRLEQMQHFLANAKPGARVRFNDPASNEMVEGVVTRITTPPQFAERQLSRYGLDIVTPGDDKPRAYTFYKLPDPRRLEWSMPDDAFLKHYDAAEPRKLRERRYMLSGNLFQAAVTAAGMRTGTVVAWNDASGDIRRGVLMPKWVNPEVLAEQPVILDTAAVARRYFEAMTARQNDDPVSLASSASHDSSRDVILYYARWEHEWRLCVPGTKAYGAAYMLDPKLREMLGDFSGNRTSMSVRVPEKKVPAVIDRLYQIGTRFVVPSSERDAVNAVRTGLIGADGEAGNARGRPPGPGPKAAAEAEEAEERAAVSLGGRP